METNSAEAATDSVTSLAVFWTMLVMLVVLVVGIVRVGSAILSVHALPW